MSLHGHVEAAAEERSGFFIGAADSDEEDHHQLILHRANGLASENRLREAIHWFSVAGSYGPVRPEQLSTFVDCILRNFKSSAAAPSAQSRASSGDADLDCPNCASFLGEPVTVGCGHTYCKRCSQRRLFSKCRICGEAVRGDEKTNVVLCGLLDKWFPEELKKSKTLREVDELCRIKHFKEAVSLATKVIQSGECR